jgi:hypothetical protein
MSVAYVECYICGELTVDTKLNCSSWPTNTQETFRADPPSEAVVKIATLVQKLQASEPGLDLQAPKSLCGRVTNALVWEVRHWQVVTDNLSVGCFIRMRNVRVRNWEITPNHKLKGKLCAHVHD